MELLVGSHRKATDHSYVSYNESYEQLLNIKNRRGLTHASPAVYNIIKLAEKVFRSTVVENPTHYLSRSNSVQRLLCVFDRSLLEDEPRTLFNHFAHSEPTVVGEPGHEFQIIRKISQSFFDIRLKYFCKLYNSSRVKFQASSRSVLNRLTIFRHE